MELAGHDLVVQEWNLDVEENVVQRIVLLVGLSLQIHGFPDVFAFRAVHQSGTRIHDVTECALNDAGLDWMMVGPGVLGTWGV